MNRPGSPLGLGLLIVGATAMAIAAFLPLNEPTGVFRAVEHNTLIQRGGWMLVLLAIGMAVGGFRANQRKGNWLALPIVLCVVAAWGIFNLATNKNLRTLYPVEANGSLDTSQPGVVAPFGLAIYLAGVGVGVALIGSVILAQTGRRSAPDAPQELGLWAPGSPPPQRAASVPAYPAPTPQGRRTPQLVFAALAVLAVVGVGIYFVTKDSNNRTRTAPAVATAALDGLLLDPSAIDTATGATGMTSGGRHAMNNAAVIAVSPPGCRAPVTEEAYSYAGSGWTASQAEELQDHPAKTRTVAQTVVLFPSAQAAATFFSASVSQWSACAHHTILATHQDGRTVKSATGPVSRTDGMLSITVTSRTLTYQHALTSANRVVIDVSVGGSTAGRYVGDEAVRIARQIAAKVPK